MERASVLMLSVSKFHNTFSIALVQLRAVLDEEDSHTATFMDYLSLTRRRNSGISLSDRIRSGTLLQDRLAVSGALDSSMTS